MKIVWEKIVFLGCEATKKQNIDTETSLSLNFIRDVTSPKSESTRKKTSIILL